MNESKQTVVLISKARLVATVGLGYKAILKDLIESGLLDSWSEVVELKFDKSKALHIQSVLEFYDTRDIPALPTPSKKKEE